MNARTEARLAAALFAACAVGLVWAMFAARCSDELHGRLLERARNGATPTERARAMNSLCLRGYWEARSREELVRFFEESPADVRAFVADQHFTLIAERRPGDVGGCATNE